MEAAPVLTPPHLFESPLPQPVPPEPGRIPAERLAARVSSPWRRVLVAGVGDPLAGDRGFGSEVAWRLSRRPLPPGVEVLDFASRGLDLVYALRQGYQAAVLVDTAPRGESPGTLTVVEPDLEREEEVALDPSALDPVELVRFARLFGRVPAQVVVVVCEPGAGEIGGGRPADARWAGERGRSLRYALDPASPERMSAPVATAVRDAVPLVESLIADLLAASPERRQVAAGRPA
jgi:hydrogenase maturation protease